MIDKNYIYLDKEYASQKDMFDHMSDILIANNLVTPEYKNAILERESEYPTGLPNQVAIPHLSSEYSLTNKIVYVRLNKPVEFVEMGTDDEFVDVKHLFFIILNEGERHIHLLSSIITMINNEDNIKALELMETIEEVKDFLDKYLEKED